MSFTTPKAGSGSLIFLYGSLMRGFPPHGRFAINLRAAYLGTGEVEGRLVDLGPYPALVPASGFITKGEVYRVKDPALIGDLDHYEDFDPSRPHASYYHRVEAPLIEDGRLVQLYRYNRPVTGRNTVPEGDWRALAKRSSAAKPD